MDANGARRDISSVRTPPFRVTMAPKTATEEALQCVFGHEAAADSSVTFSDSGLTICSRCVQFALVCFGAKAQHVCSSPLQAVGNYRALELLCPRCGEGLGESGVRSR